MKIHIAAASDLMASRRTKKTKAMLVSFAVLETCVEPADVNEDIKNKLLLYTDKREVFQTHREAVASDLK